MKKILLYLLVVLPIISSPQTSLYANEKQFSIHATSTCTQNIKKEQHTITVWVHGTRLLRHYIFSDFYYRKIGLHHAQTYKSKHQLKRIANNLSSQKNTRFNFNNFYCFGWSGKLSHSKRKIAAKTLHKSLLILIQEYKKKYGVIPKIRLITHSHGGNVALYFGKINDKKANKINISELILLACPVQKKTSHLVASKTFDKVCSICSDSDITQVMDPQGLHQIKKWFSKEITFFSERTFTPQKKLVQIKIKINNKGIKHNDFLLDNFIKIIPYILQKIDIWTNSPDIYKETKILNIVT